MIRPLIVAILLLNGMIAVFIGISLIMAPDGTLLKIETTMLERGPFNSFLIPGKLLFVIIGVGSMLSALLTVFSIKYYPQLVTGMGIANLIWIASLIYKTQTWHSLHLVFGLIGLTLLIFGIVKWRKYMKFGMEDNSFF
jgi:hypothetical protein